MCRKTYILENFDVHQSYFEEIDKCWVRIPEEAREKHLEGMKSRKYVSLCVNGKTIFAQIRGVVKKKEKELQNDYAPIDVYNSIRISDYYRETLGLQADDYPKKVDIKIIEQCQLFGMERAMSTHPDDVSRLAFKVSAVSFIIAIISLIIGVFL